MANTYNGHRIFFDGAVAVGTATTNYVDTNGPHATDDGRACGDLHCETMTLINQTASPNDIVIAAADHDGGNAYDIREVNLAADGSKTMDLMIHAPRLYIRARTGDADVYVDLR